MPKSLIAFLLVLCLACASHPSRADARDDMLARIESLKQDCQAKAKVLQEQQRARSPIDATAASDGANASENTKRAAAHVKQAAAMEATLEQLQALPVPKGAAEMEAYAQQLFNATQAADLVSQSMERDHGAQVNDLASRTAARIAQVIDSDPHGPLFQFGGGNPNSIVGFEGSRPRPATHIEVLNISGSRLLGQTSGIRTVAVQAPATVRELTKDFETYGSTPQGVVLEGTATGLGAIHRVRYDKSLNALLLDDRAVYFLRVPPWEAALLCHAIAEDFDKKTRKNPQRIGVSIGDKLIAYGVLPVDSSIAENLLLVDRFLGDIVFGGGELIEGYKLAEGYVLQKQGDENSRAAVTFRLKDFAFKIDHEVVQPVGDGLEVTVYPTSTVPAPDGGGQPDTDAVRRGARFPQYEANAAHIAKHIGWYRREPLIENAFAYGQTAAVLRALLASHVDVDELARVIERSK